MKSAPIFCAILAASVFTVPTFAETFGGWNSTRAGSQLSIVDGTETTGLRVGFNTAFPGSTVSGTDTLTASYLNTIDVAVLWSATGSTSAITALTSTEQTNLLNFVKGGKEAVIFVDNDSFAPDADAANNSLLAPFGLHSTGTLINWQLADTLPSPITTPSGPFGNVSTIDTLFPGWFDNLGPNAIDAANLEANGESVLAYIAPGSLGAGSGPVVLFSDSIFANSGGYDNNHGMIVNALGYPNTGSGVPEPASLAIVGLGGAALVLRRRRNGSE